MRHDKFTTKFQMAIADAQSLALGRDHQFIEPAHLMQALMDQEGGSVRPLFTIIGANISQFRSELGKLLDKMPEVQGAEGEVQLSQGTAKLLNLCDKYAQQRKDAYISSELFLLAATEDKGPLGELFKKLGIKKDALEKAINDIRDGQNVDDPNAEEKRQALDKYTIDLTERAAQGKLDPV
ncbi:MAG TPA: type VI secretion system ATPase TssH, partial [Idiomarina baltica]|nr:type VI secretion system ATPase TssH [Idiomarina baltica]